MRIAHICLSCFYIDGFGYQENELVRQNINDGHEVLVIASTESFGVDGKYTYLQPSTYLGTDGAAIVRLPYRKFLPHAIMKKLRFHPGLRELLRGFAPDSILFHGLCGWEVNTVAEYKRLNPTVRLYLDGHEDHNNSARTFLSRHVLHRYYGWVLRRCLREVTKILCVSMDSIEFAVETYHVPRELIEFYPLGGEVFDDTQYEARRARGRQACNVSDRETLFVQSGKMGSEKKVLETIAAFRRTSSNRLRMVLVGSFDEAIRDRALCEIADDKRITFVGWKSPDQLKDLLCAADLYVQPGSQSATMQTSLCARCPVVLEDVISHRPYVHGNGWLIRDTNELAEIFREIADQPELLTGMAAASLKIAWELLDYRVLSARILR